jgi:hypothetical protein
VELVLTRRVAGANTSGVAYVTFIPQFEPVNYFGSNTLEPGARSEWVIGYTADDDVFTNSTSITLPIGDKDQVITPPTRGYVWQFEPTLPINPEDTGNLLQNFGRFQSYLQDAQTSGKFALSVYMEVVGGGSNAIQFHSTRGTTAPGLSVVQHNYHSGVMGWPMDRRARVRHDPKSGFPGLSDEFIDDGYRQGLKVLPRSWDPEDRTNMDFFPPPSEGVIDDEVP